ncbi:TetR/AcrR family transcriptional regulator [Streptosporangium minutum]|uniref:TetR family transcriptional regulator n=1 Tax=Streptosporangium minutum TaxID=569862 RepID=A0A2C9ZLU7_9ACTN|nr:TetR/AcrR family transcriptional regulator [Streptosporangium minutum]OUC94274.1 TetR family transcriptional regulator [Streptosporangium minutum]
MGSSVRRSPVQQRSVERVNQMLDAAAALLDEGGYDALSTRAVAARAEVPVGSIYRFFRDKRGLADALAQRNLERFLARIERRLAGVAHWPDMADLIVDEYVEMKRTVPGFAVVDFTGNRAVAESLADHLARRIAPAGPDRRPVDTAGLHRPLLVAVEAADALLKLAFRESPDGAPGYIAETKQLLRAYLEHVLSR